MVEALTVHPAIKTPNGWQFRVEVVDRPHLVSVSQADWKKLTKEAISPMELVRMAIEVLLSERSPQILPAAADLSDLAKLIPDFLKTVRNRIRSEVAGNPT